MSDRVAHQLPSTKPPFTEAPRDDGRTSRVQRLLDGLHKRKPILVRSGRAQSQHLEVFRRTYLTAGHEEKAFAFGSLDEQRRRLPGRAHSPALGRTVTACQCGKSVIGCGLREEKTAQPSSSCPGGGDVRERAIKKAVYREAAVQVNVRVDDEIVGVQLRGGFTHRDPRVRVHRATLPAAYVIPAVYLAVRATHYSRPRTV